LSPASRDLLDGGWMQPSIYHRGLMVGETPNIDSIGQEGAIFMDYVAMQSCTSGQNALPISHRQLPACHIKSPQSARPLIRGHEREANGTKQDKCRDHSRLSSPARRLVLRPSADPGMARF
jgi:hypothetical protein